MSDFARKIKQSLDEARILVLVAQVLIGFEFSSVFESRFATLPEPLQYLKLGALTVMMVALGLLITPSAYHRIVERGEDTAALQRFTSGLMIAALAPFVVGLTIDIYVATERVMGHQTAIVAAGATTGVTAFFWYGLELIARRRRRGEARQEVRAMKSQPSSGRTELAQKVEQVLTETRVVLPGAQALLGFQFASMLTDAFARLPVVSQRTHLLSLALVALAAILLMTPAAYHRLVERGEDTERFHRFASGCLLTAMVPLALGIAGDFYVVTEKVTRSPVVAAASAAVALFFFYGLWFGLTSVLRTRRRVTSPRLRLAGGSRRRSRSTGEPTLRSNRESP